MNTMTSNSISVRPRRLGGTGRRMTTSLAKSAGPANGTTIRFAAQARVVAQSGGWMRRSRRVPRRQATLWEGRLPERARTSEDAGGDRCLERSPAVGLTSDIRAVSRTSATRPPTPRPGTDAMIPDYALFLRLSSRKPPFCLTHATGSLYLTYRNSNWATSPAFLTGQRIRIIRIDSSLFPGTHKRPSLHLAVDNLSPFI